MRGATGRTYTVSFGLIAVFILGGTVAALMRLHAQGVAGPLWIGGAMIFIIVILMSLWSLHGTIIHHLTTLERLRAGVLVAAIGKDGRLPPPPRTGPGDDAEVSRMREALETLLSRRLAPATPDDRLKAVLATLDEGIVVITESGQVSLVNAPAKAMLGGVRVALGTSVFAGLERGPLLAAWDTARKSGGAVDWTLEDVDGHTYSAKVAILTGHGGAVIRLTMEGDQRFCDMPVIQRAGALDTDLSLHDEMPQVSMDEDTPLLDLPVLSFDAETTGLDINSDRMVSLGGVRVHGTRVFHIANVDRLVNPGMPIPSRSMAVHGITDEMVADAPVFREIFPVLEPLMRGAVMVGHNVGFDVAMLRRECTLAGIEWHDLPTLDTFLLGGMLFPDITDLSLENVAERLGVDIHGRHTALGDALVTAEIFVRMLPLLESQGVTTYAQAREFQMRATMLVNKQKAMGW
ncbi:MAG: 3'-5' exonuclease [Rhodospirillaceae bacterium]